MSQTPGPWKLEQYMPNAERHNCKDHQFRCQSDRDDGLTVCCYEGPPHICFQKGCPRPICDPCVNPNWGYFETCWNPWPWP